jgi:hypothetical protein
MRLRQLTFTPIILAVVGLPSDRALALTTRWVVDGTACQQFDDGGYSRTLWVYGDSGTIFKAADGYSVTIGCPIPIGVSLVSLDPADANHLNRVELRFSETTVDDDTLTETRLFAHDDVSEDFCECDQDDRTGGIGQFTTTLYFKLGATGICDTCNGGGYVPSDWVVTAEVNHINDAGGSNWSYLAIKRMTVYSDG